VVSRVPRTPFTTEVVPVAKVTKVFLSLGEYSKVYCTRLSSLAVPKMSVGEVSSESVGGEVMLTVGV